MMMQLQQALKLGQSVPDINNSSTSLYFRFSKFVEAISQNVFLFNSNWSQLMMMQFQHA